MVVTGVGVASALGGDLDATIERLFAGERGFAGVSLFSTEGYASHLAAEATWLPTSASRSRSDALAVQAASEALARAGVDPRRERVELWIAASVGGMLETEVPLTHAFLGRPLDAGPELLRLHPTSAPADAVHAGCGPFASTRTVCSACSSGLVALGMARDRVRRGDADVVLAGGVDALSRLTFAGFSALSSLDPAPCRPFDRDRAGLNLGEGAAFVVLERADRAASRGALAIAELAGFAVACEAHHVTQPEESGETAERVMRRALASAGVDATAIGHVSAHGTGTPRNDAMEAVAIARALGGHRALVSSPKAQLGHTLAAAGALSAAIAAESVRRGVVPPAVGAANVDEALPIALAGARGEPRSDLSVLVNAFGFGGNDASLVLTAVGRSSPRAVTPDEPLVITSVATLGPLGALVGEAVARYVDPAERVDGTKEPEDPRAWLDEALSRRSDLPGRYALALALLALEGSARRDAVGIVTGSAFAACDTSAAFYARVMTKGPRFAAPLVFPGLVPSGPASAASIALGARGPSLAVADLGVSALAALDTAIALVRGDHAPAMIAIALEPPSLLVETSLSRACSRQGEGPRGAGGAAFRVERASASTRPLAAIERVVTFRGAAPAIRGPRSARGEVFAVNDDPHTRAFAWSDRPLRVVGPRSGWHEAAGGIALAAAVARIASGAIDEAEVILEGPDRGGVCLLVRP